MFLIECNSDNSLCIMEDEYVIYDNTVDVEIDDEVTFLSGGKEFKGYVRMYSDNLEDLRFKRTQLKKQQKVLMEKNRSVLEKACSTKRIPKRKEIYSPEKENLTKKVAKTRTQPKKDVVLESDLSQRQVANLIKKRKIHTHKLLLESSSESSDGDEELVITGNNNDDLFIISESKDIKKKKETNAGLQSPSKEELKRIAAEANAKLHALRKKIGDNDRKEAAIKEVSDVEIHSPPPHFEQLIEKTPSRKHKNDQDVDALVKPNSSLNQLYGRDFQSEPMTEIGNSGVYCIDAHLQYALSAHEVTHMARRLIEGVFTKEAITKSTFTGQSARAQGKSRQKMPVVALNDYAKNAIIDFAIIMGTKRNWIIPQRSAINASMTQRLGELKRLINSAATTTPMVTERHQ